jgi:hypothetical protein
MKIDIAKEDLWWAERCAHIAELMKNTGVGELIIRRKENGKYTFEITPESETTETP